MFCWKTPVSVFSSKKVFCDASEIGSSVTVLRVDYQLAFYSATFSFCCTFNQDVLWTSLHYDNIYLCTTNDKRKEEALLYYNALQYTNYKSKMVKVFTKLFTIFSLYYPLHPQLGIGSIKVSLHCLGRIVHKHCMCQSLPPLTSPS